jgi:hypothetical protein
MGHCLLKPPAGSDAGAHEQSRERLEPLVANSRDWTSGSKRARNGSSMN